ncbi:MAG: heterodisulfide reductase-related iron-sulfur binding cluster [Bacteroidales bacterium]|jgi:heterodisulfide reductase subunit B|nr:heterodisulfide reductase-related iron-sulfur binding cluster [Bacteroidales bacterium]
MNIEGKRRVWKDYQKEIAGDNFFYVRSCVRQNFFPGSEKTFLRILKEELHKDIFENAAHTTCSGIGYHSDIVPFETTMTIVARQFALMTESGYENFATSCITSFGLYTEILETWHHFPEVEERIRKHLKNATGREFSKPKNLSHASDIIFKFRKEIAAVGKYRLINHYTGKPLRAVEHIGCHYSRMFPSKGIGGAEYPYVLIGMIEDWGGEVIDYPERRHCCGFGFRQYLIQANRGYSLSCSKKKFDSMAPYKPDFILTNCPGCPMFLDRWQYTISEMEGITYGENGHGIPVLTYEELAGMILGYDPWDLGLQVHQVPVEPLLDKMGIPYNADSKFLNKEGASMGKPKAPSFLKFY